MATFPTRFIKITLSDGTRSLDVQDLKIEFDLEKALRPRPNAGTIRIWNLKDSTAKFAKGATEVQIVAGYANNSGLVYKGDLRRASNRRKGQEFTTKREGINMVTELGIGGHLEALTSAYFQQSYAGTVPLKNVVTDALPTFSLVAANIDVLPDITLEDFTWSGKTSDLLDSLLLDTDFGWYEDDGLIVFHETETPVELNPVKVSANTGLLSTPEIQRFGVKFTTMLNPALRIGGLVDLESIDNPEANGRWKIKKLKLRGSNRAGQHISEVEVRRAT